MIKIELLLPRIQTLIGASERLLALMDEVKTDPTLGDNTDRVFTRYEFDDLRAAVQAIDPDGLARLLVFIRQ